jgi:MYXO-CTERM domain-containing protein
MSGWVVAKLIGVVAVVVGVAVAVMALLGFLVTPWVTVGMGLFVLVLLAVHRRRTVRFRQGDLEFRVRHRPAWDDNSD